MNSLFGPATEDDRWRYDTYSLIERQAAQRGGTTVERPYSRGRESTYTEPAPLQAIQAARFVRAVADERAKHFAKRARGDGHGWDVISEALGLAEPAKNEERSRGDLAFEMVAGAPAMRFDHVTVHWTSSTCGEFVKDNGPYNLHPEDQEEGHAADFSRYRQAVTEYEAAATRSVAEACRARGAARVDVPGGARSRPLSRRRVCFCSVDDCARRLPVAGCRLPGFLLRRSSCSVRPCARWSWSPNIVGDDPPTFGLCWRRGADTRH